MIYNIWQKKTGQKKGRKGGRKQDKRELFCLPLLFSLDEVLCKFTSVHISDMSKSIVTPAANILAYYSYTYISST